MDLYRRRRIDAQIDMTPMIDTLLQLFMIFLLSASFVASAVQLDLPQASAEQKNPARPVVLSLNPEGDLFLDDAPVARADLRPSLEAALAKAQNRQVLVRADRALAYQQVLQVLVELQTTGAVQVLLEYDAQGGR